MPSISYTCIGKYGECLDKCTYLNNGTKIGSNGCVACKYFVYHNKVGNIIKCIHPKCKSTIPKQKFINVRRNL